jgi:O-antigen/teichoic acid export membrane protein
MRRSSSSAVGRRSALVVVDQGVWSLTNVIAAIVAARIVTREEFGAVALIIAVYVVCLGVSRAFATDCVLIFRSDSPRRENAPHFEGAAAMAIAVGVAEALVIACALPFVPGVVRAPLLVLALSLPALLLQDCWRYVFLADARPGAALANDVVWLVAEGLLVIPLLVGRPSTAAPYVAMWCLAGAVAALVGFAQARCRPRLRSLGPHFRRYRDLSLRFVADFMLYALGAQLTIVLVSFLLGVADVGALQGALVLIGPVTTLFAGLGVAAVAEGARARSSPARLCLHFLLLAGALALVGLLWGAILLAFPESLGEAILGATWGDARSVLPAIVVVAACGGVAAATLAGLRVYAAATQILRVRLVSAPLALVATAVGAATGGLEGAAVGMALAALVGAGLMSYALVRCGSLASSRRIEVPRALASKGASD